MYFTCVQVEHYGTSCTHIRLSTVTRLTPALPDAYMLPLHIKHTHTIREE